MWLIWQASLSLTTCDMHVCFLTPTAAEPWPETATLYQPLKGKAVFGLKKQSQLTLLRRCCCCLHDLGSVFAEDQILLSDCASSLAVQVTFSLCVCCQQMKRHLCIFAAASLSLCADQLIYLEVWLLICLPSVLFFFCAGLPQDVRSASAGGLQSKRRIHVAFWLVDAAVNTIFENKNTSLHSSGVYFVTRLDAGFDWITLRTSSLLNSRHLGL